MTELTSCPQCKGPIEPGMRFCPGCGFEALPGSGTLAGIIEAPAVTDPFLQLPAQMELLRQATLGEYDILGELGQGGMATVFLAHDIALDRKVALKLMSPALIQGPGLAERFRREAKTAASLSHPHIIPIYAVKEDPRVLYFVMKFVPGRSLESILRDIGPLPFPMVRTILTEVGGALDYAHRRGIVHRDVKPGNIMVDEDGYAVVTDFGIAKALQSPGLTQTGTMVGTPSFLSPEACLGDEVTAASDQYSLGIVAYQMLTGELPFTATTNMGFLYAQVHTPPVPVRRLRRGCPPELHAAVMQMLKKAPEDRWSTLKDAVTAISAAIPPISDADRSAIGALAKSRPSREAAGLRTTPSSPLPTLRRPYVSTAEMAAPTQALPWRIVRAARTRAALVPWAVAGGTALLLAGGWLLLRNSTPKPPPPSPVVTPAPVTPAPVAADSLQLAARGAATYARQRAVAAGASTRALAPGDSLQALAESLGVQGRRADAFGLLTQAMASWNAAEQKASVTRTEVARTTAAREHPPAVAPAQPAPDASKAGAPVPSTENPTLSDSQVVVKFYEELGDAIRARQLGEVRRLFPNITDTEDRRWRSLFEDEDVEKIEARYVVSIVTRREGTIYAGVASLLDVTKKGKLDRKEKRQRVILTLGPQGWRQIKAEDVK